MEILRPEELPVFDRAFLLQWNDYELREHVIPERSRIIMGEDVLVKVIKRNKPGHLHVQIEALEWRAGVLGVLQQNQVQVSDNLLV